MAALAAVPAYMQGILIVILCSLLRTYAQERCTMTRRAYADLGFSAYDVLHEMTLGNNLRVCGNGHSCCTRDMENSLTRHSKQEYDKIMANKIGLLRNIFVSRTAKFDAFFTELLENSKRDLHEMFVRTYGLLYQQNSYIFNDLFKDVHDYYKGHDINLMDALDNFFSILLQKMFELINAQYTFDQNYLTCVTEHMDDLRPFGDVPQKLSVQVKRAFIAARTFVQGLSIGRDVVLAVSKITPSESCSNAILKMSYCPYCRGMPSIQPCNNYCMNVMKGCLAYHADLNHEWNQYIHELLKLAERLEGPFNIELVVDPIDVKISDAIMNFQENSETVSNKVFSGCGQPRLGRKKRDAYGGSTLDNTGMDYNFNNNRRNQQEVRPTTAAGTNLDRLVRDIKSKIEVARDFWKDLPHSVCNNMAAPMQEDHNCWNGLSMARYRPEVMGDGVRNQNNNPEVDIDVRKPNFVINQQLLQLRLITSKLRVAYNGMDVDWIDTADAVGSGSGSGGQMDDGSAEGSGYMYPGRDDFNLGQPWVPPISVQTRRPPQSRKNDPNHYQENNYYHGSHGSTVHSSQLFVFVTVLFTTMVLHRNC